MTTDELIDQLKKFLGAKLRSVVAYGSTVRDGDVDNHSDVNLAVITTDLTIETLAEARSALVPWLKKGNAAPVFFTSEQLANALDVFPIEFLDMTQNHRVLSGTDPFVGVSVDIANVRRQLEYELRVKQIQLRRVFMEVGDHALEAAAAKGISSLTALMRASLAMAGKAAPAKRTDVWREMATLAPIDAELGEKKAASDPKQLFERLARTLDAMVKFVDGYQGRS